MSEVLPIDEHSPCRGLHNAEQSTHEGRLATACAPHNADLFPGIDAEGEAFQDQVQIISIPHLHSQTQRASVHVLRDRKAKSVM